MKKEIFIDIAAYAFVILFVYTSVNKLISYDFYLRDLKRSPLLGDYALPISVWIPLVELITAIFLLFTKTRGWGFLGALILMVIFTGYVAYVIFLTSDRPCTCGGIIRELTWPQHLIFNITFLLLAISVLILQKK